MAGVKPVTEETIRSTDTNAVPWEEVTALLAEAGTFWLATTREEGHAHVRPILAVWADDALHFATGTSARKSSNLEHSSLCAISTCVTGLDLVIEGHARRVTDETRLRHVADVYQSTYQWSVDILNGAFCAEGAPTAGPPPFHVFEVVPTTVFGFGTDEGHAERSTRWRF